MAQSHSATVRARRLGVALRKLREDNNLTFEHVAKRLGCHHTKVRRIEKAEVKAEIADIEELLDIYGVDPAHRLELLDWAQNAWRRGWWDAYPDILTGPFVALEDEAATIRSWQTVLIPGLLQTDDYARALISTAVPKPDEREVEDRLGARMQRRKILSRASAPRLHAVIGEAALRQQVGGVEVMRVQRKHLLEVADRSNVTVQVVPYVAGAHTGVGGQFVVFSFDHEADPDVAYIENLGGDLYVESEDAVSRFRMAWSNIVGVALSPSESVAFIAAHDSEE